MAELAHTLRPLRRWFDGRQLVKFSLVGASGYAVNLAVFTLLVGLAGTGLRTAATCSFLVAVANNYLWNRLWTFRARRGRVMAQAVRFLTVALAGYCLNLLVLAELAAAGLGALPAQALAIALVMPLSFGGNKAWSFRDERSR